MENLLENTDKLKGALQEKVIENADKIRMSKYLATIKTDVPIDTDIASLERKPIDIDELIKIYTELEFRTLIARLKAGNAASEAVAAKAVNTAAGEATTAPDGSGMGSLFDLADASADEESAPKPPARIAITAA